MAQGSIVPPEQNLAIERFGGYPVSHNISSLWLSGSDGRPLVMIYYYGPKDWYETQWSLDSKLKIGKREWVELRSENVTVRVEVYPETWEVAIQARKFSVRQSNTFLVLHTGELLVPQEVIPLGVFDLPPSTDKPASVLLLRTYLELADRIENEAKAGINTSQIGKSPHHSLRRPCAQENIDFLYRNPRSGLRAALLFPSVMSPEKLLSSTYAIPCRRSPVFSMNVQ